MIHDGPPPNLETVIPPCDPAPPAHHSQTTTLDDVFASETDDSHGPSVEPSEIPRLRSTHVTNGYRNGVSDSKVRFVQDGFDEGYALGAALGLKAGWVLGVAEGLVKALGQRRIRRRRQSGRALASTGSAVDAVPEEVSLDEREELERKRGEMLVEAQDVLARARTELAVQNLFGPGFLDKDGIWTWAVPGEEGDITFQEVASAHPLVKKWTKTIRDLAVLWNVDLDATVKASETQDNG